jgi:hypothetical protein
MLISVVTHVSWSVSVTYLPAGRDSSVGIVLGYGLGDRGSRVRFPAESGNFSLHHRVQPTQPPIQRVPGTVSLGVKRQGREADHSPPSSAGVKNAWSYTSTPQYVFMAWCLVKHRHNFTFTFTLLLRTCRLCIACGMSIGLYAMSNWIGAFEVHRLDIVPEGIKKSMENINTIAHWWSTRGICTLHGTSWP